MNVHNPFGLYGKCGFAALVMGYLINSVTQRLHRAVQILKIIT